MSNFTTTLLKFLHRGLYSFSSTMFFVNFLKKRIKRSKSLLIFPIMFFLFIVFIKYYIVCISLIKKAHATPAEIGTTTNPTPVTGKVTESLVAPILTTASNDSNIEVRLF